MTDSFDLEKVIRKTYHFQILVFILVISQWFRSISIRTLTIIQYNKFPRIEWLVKILRFVTWSILQRIIAWS